MDERTFCPLCGQPIGFQDRDGWRRAPGRSFPMIGGRGGAPALAPGMSWERRAPARAAELMSDVGVPLLQAGVTGLVGGLAGWAASGWPGAIVGTGLTFGVSWLGLLASHRSALWTVERLVGADLDRDGHVGEPADPVVILRGRGDVERSGDEVATTVTQTVRSPNRRLALDLAEFLARGKDIGYGIRDWTGENQRRLSTGTLVTDGLWREWTGMLREAGWLETRGGKTRLAGTLDEALRAIMAGGRE